MAMTIATAASGSNRLLKSVIKHELPYKKGAAGGLILSVDPGANGTGWALLNINDSHVHDFGTIHGQNSNWNYKAVEILGAFEVLLKRTYICQVIMESPVFMRGYGGYTTASTGDLVKLAMLCGAMYFMSVRLHGTELVEPSKWKGQLPKKVCNERVRRILEQQNLFTGKLGRISNHALDAVGIGLWRLGRFV